jgi:hypothetical protein
MNVACSSTILCEVAFNKVEVLRFDAHQKAVDTLSKDPNKIGCAPLDVSGPHLI